MSVLFLRLLDRLLTPILLFLALWLFFRGHNQPGGGFIAGLAMAAAFQLQILSRGDAFVRARVGPYLQPMTGIGLLAASAAALLGLLEGSFLKAIWVFWHIGPLEIELGTPQLFDLGVFLVVVSVVVSYLLSLSLNKEGESE
ncbi:MAG: Na(+)/H(+) antiporter subunit B [Caldilineaceae bacterium]|nr:Na(+)/H(+) antiporter subunit B [Caldilineaceae bacterium]